ncbi:hypothetical protein U1Q18_031437 [Sarracenia purpurea var. burkii]
MKTTYQWDNLSAKVKSTETKFQNINAEYRNVQKYLCGMLPFFKLRMLSKHITETTKEAVKENNEMRELMRHGNVMIERREEPVAADIVELNSLHQNVQELLKLLQFEEEKQLFGEASVKANKNGRFDIVIFLTFRRDDNVTKIQEDLLKLLKLSVNGIDSKEQRTAQRCTAATEVSRFKLWKYGLTDLIS